MAKIEIIEQRVEAHAPNALAATVYINVGAEFEDGREYITFSVVVPNEGTEERQIERGRQRAKRLANLFVDSLK